jgi:hypothetical protein
MPYVKLTRFPPTLQPPRWRTVWHLGYQRLEGPHGVVLGARPPACAEIAPIQAGLDCAAWQRYPSCQHRLKPFLSRARRGQQLNASVDGPPVRLLSRAKHAIATASRPWPAWVFSWRRMQAKRRTRRRGLGCRPCRLRCALWSRDPSSNGNRHRPGRPRRARSPTARPSKA